jgi:hypothetical protein
VRSLVTDFRVRAKWPDGAESVFGVQAEDRETAVGKALQILENVLVPLDLEITVIPPPEPG